MSANISINPLRKGLPRENVVDPCIVVIFGGTGDLAHRKLLPSLYRLFLEGLLPRSFAIVSYASPDLTDEQYRESIRESISKIDAQVPTQGATWDEFAQTLRYVRRTGDLIESLTTLKTHLEKIDSEINIKGNYLFYMAVPPFVFEEYSNGLKEVGLVQEQPGRGWRRIVIEKPFGDDLQSARKLNNTLQHIFREEQIYRIDHYLGKETVQNILVFRFANQFIEPLMNARYVDHIQITVAEAVGVEGRGGYYDNAGALKDMVQNHMLQLLALTCMEPPAALDAESIRDEKAKILKSVRTIDPQKINEIAIRAQYSSGRFMGKNVSGYKEEEKVETDSKTETYVALKLFVDNWRWEGVPIYIRTGKRMAKRATEIGIQLRDIPNVIFGEVHKNAIEPNVIALNIQPDEGISIRFDAKVPGLSYRIQPVRMDFKYGTSFSSTAPEAYERLILDALLGDPSLYARADATEASWEITDPILEGWRATNSPIYAYAPGSWGPKEASDFVARDGRKWRRL